MIDNNVIISICGFITTITVTVLNQRASARKSKEDRDAKSLEMRTQLALSTKLAELKAEKMFREQSADLTHKLTHAKDAIQKDLAENTQISSQAFEEANHVNERLQTVSEIREVVEDSRRILKDHAPIIKRAVEGKVEHAMLYDFDCASDDYDELEKQQDQQIKRIEDASKEIHLTDEER